MTASQDLVRSPRLQARVAGFLYLIIILTGAVGYSIHSSLFVWNDAATTASNIMSSEQMWRLSFGAMLIMISCDVGVAVIFYLLFKPVNRTLSIAACALRLVLVAILGIAILGRYMPLILLKNDFLSALNRDQLNEMGLLFIKFFELGFDTSLVFFGFHCLAIGWLIYQSDFLPRFLGVLLILAGICYLVSTFINLVFTEVSLPFDIQLVSYVAEVVLCLWLMIVGLNTKKWVEQSTL